MGKDVIIACDFGSKEEVINFLSKFTEEKPHYSQAKGKSGEPFPVQITSRRSAVAGKRP